jgi:hypothetical protein
MPLTEKGEKIMAAMRKTYPTKKKAEQVFYASENAGKITGVHKKGARSMARKAQGK